MATVIRGDDNFDTASPINSVAIVAQVQPPASHQGGTYTSSSGWVDYPLNTEISDEDSIVSVANNQFTLGAGKYLIRWSGPTYKTTRFITRLYNKTDSSVVASGSGGHSWASDNTSNNSHGNHIMTLTSSKSFSIMFWGETTSGGYGLGIGTNNVSGTNNVFCQVIIHKIGA